VGDSDLLARAVYQPDPGAAAAARRFVRDTLQGWVPDPARADGHGLVDDAVLLTSELVTNAVVHARTPVQVTCRLAEGEVEVEVSDQHPAGMVPDPAVGEVGPGERTGGRGLLLPAALASEWGVTYGRDTKSVWFRLGVPGPVSSRAGPGVSSRGGPGVSSRAGPDHFFPAGPDRSSGAARDRDGWDVGVILESAAVPDRAAVPGRAALPGGDGYQELLASTAESLRAAVSADAGMALTAGEEGDLRVRATAGTLPAGLPASVLAVPLLAEGRVTGLLVAVASAPGRFGDPEAAAAQRLADARAQEIHRAWLAELAWLRQVRVEALSEARGLLARRLGQGEVLALAGRVTVPRLVTWCAVLLPDSEGRLRRAYLRHADPARRAPLARLLDRWCSSAVPGAVPGDYGAGPRSGVAGGWRFLLGEESERAPSSAPGETAWCFSLGEPGRGVFMLGSGHPGWLPREVAVLAADIAGRIGLALAAQRPERRSAERRFAERRPAQYRRQEQHRQEQQLQEQQLQEQQLQEQQLQEQQLQEQGSPEPGSAGPSPPQQGSPRQRAPAPAHPAAPARSAEPLARH
jgi:anti-sigma regulatory factor (Ser/Thr protein kinase)